MNAAYLTIALPKGRIGKDAIERLASLGIKSVVKTASRKLVFFDEIQRIRYIFVKASDVVTYVSEGVSDLGIVGKDNILEEDRHVYEIKDLGFGKCDFAIAGFPGTTLYQKDTVLKVATKYPNVARAHFLKKRQPIHIIPLQGSVELGPIIGLSDVIVDIVETGNTLKANGLEILEPLMALSARLIVNPASYRFKHERIKAVMALLEERTENND